MPNPLTILAQVLIIIKYPGDKKEFIDDFADLCIKKGLETATQSLPFEKQKELVNRIKDLTNPKEALTIIGQYVPISKYQEAVNKATTDLFADFLTTIEPDLLEEQKNALDKYFDSLEKEKDKEI
jgi:hypothetical protein